MQLRGTQGEENQVELDINAENFRQHKEAFVSINANQRMEMQSSSLNYICLHPVKQSSFVT